MVSFELFDDWAWYLFRVKRIGVCTLNNGVSLGKNIFDPLASAISKVEPYLNSFTFWMPALLG